MKEDSIFHPLGASGYGDPLNQYWTFGLKRTVVLEDETYRQLGAYIRCSDLIRLDMVDPLLVEFKGLLSEMLDTFTRRHNEQFPCHS